MSIYRSKSTRRPKTAAQNRKIWALANQLGLDEGLLRGVVEGVTGDRSISKLSHRQAFQVIAALEKQISTRRRQKKRVGAPSSRISKSQMVYLHDLAAKADWSEWDLRAWLKRYFRVQHERWLTNKNAVKAITALKEIAARTPKEE